MFSPKSMAVLLSAFGLTVISPCTADPVRPTDAQQAELDAKKAEVAANEAAVVTAAQKADQSKRDLAALEEQYQLNTRPATEQELLQRLADKGEIKLIAGRAYPIPGQPYPQELKCTTADIRIINGCLQLRFFDPSTRVYFDTGNDDDNEVDLFNDGNLNITVDLVSIYWPWRLGYGAYFDKWSWGPVLGAGIGAPATNNSDDPDTNVSGAPVVLLSAGGMLEYRLKDGPAFAFEVGGSEGFTTDESFGDTDDFAVYVGLRINVPLGEKPRPVASAP